ncbi:SigE family RNA polymerase sigma factor [Jiangella gansuensis]|uniref:SigE family RNA polymerase sigma factor n=1 Tax=Jiangella gansuensis TaxID=281473 RepID=UPI0004789742|nr:SigE family RNA polymerase sigma factor [Jiangella gansuensis]
MLAIDEASFRAFVDARSRPLLRTAFLLTGDWQLAEDLVQETLTKIYVVWRRVTRRDELDAYARKVLVNTYIDTTRRPWRREHVVEVVPDRIGTGDPGDSADPTTRDRLLTALAAVPARQRAVLILRFWEDLSVDQVAELLACSSGNVKSQTSRGLERLRQVLGPQMLATMEEQL